MSTFDTLLANQIAACEDHYLQIPRKAFSLLDRAKLVGVLLNIQNLPNLNREFPETEWMIFKKHAGNLKTFAQKFLLASPPDPFMEVSFQLQTLNLSKVLENFWFWRQNVLESSKPAVFRIMTSKNTFQRKKATEKRISLEEHVLNGRRGGGSNRSLHTYVRSWE